MPQTYLLGILLKATHDWQTTKKKHHFLKSNRLDRVHFCPCQLLKLRDFKLAFNLQSSMTYFLLLYNQFFKTFVNFFELSNSVTNISENIDIPSPPIPRERSFLFKCLHVFTSNGMYELSVNTHINWSKMIFGIRNRYQNVRQLCVYNLPQSAQQLWFNHSYLGQNL